eukprot:scaffold93660_cov49-Prasinocladus_malaysianus.AAC.4
MNTLSVGLVRAGPRVDRAAGPSRRVEQAGPRQQRPQPDPGRHHQARVLRGPGQGAGRQPDAQGPRGAAVVPDPLHRRGRPADHPTRCDHPLGCSR